MARLYKSICYCTNMWRSANILNSYYDDVLKEMDLTVSQYYLLVNLLRMEKANITHWADAVGLERSTMVRNTRQLLKRALIEETEGNGKTYKLSEKGEDILQKAIPLWEKTQKQMEEFLGAEDAEAILRIGSKLQHFSWNQ